MYDLNDDDVTDQVAALPPDARVVFEELRSVIALVPWRSEPASHANPDGEVRFVSFRTGTGFGFVYYLLELIWLG